MEVDELRFRRLAVATGAVDPGDASTVARELRARRRQGDAPAGGLADLLVERGLIEQAAAERLHSLLSEGIVRCAPCDASQPVASLPLDRPLACDECGEALGFDSIVLEPRPNGSSNRPPEPEPAPRPASVIDVAPGFAHPAPAAKPAAVEVSSSEDTLAGVIPLPLPPPQRKKTTRKAKQKAKRKARGKGRTTRTAKPLPPQPTIEPPRSDDATAIVPTIIPPSAIRPLPTHMISSDGEDESQVVDAPDTGAPGETAAEGATAIMPSGEGSASSESRRRDADDVYRIPVVEAHVPGGMPTPSSFGSFGLPRLEITGYETIGLLGRGGFGDVYKAKRLSDDEIVAVKVLAIERASGQSFIERFKREVAMATKLQHPSLVRVFDWGVTGPPHEGYPYYVMEFIEGHELHEMLRRNEIPPRRALEIIRDVASALFHAHQQGVIHRDIKAANIRIDPQGLPKLYDFGLAKDLSIDESLTVTGDLLGTPAYMAPEQVSGRKITDVRSDIYSLGVVLYEMLAGTTPFHGSPLQILTQLTIKDPTPPSEHRPDIPKAIEEICLRAMARDPANRFQTAQELEEACEWILAPPCSDEL